MKSISLYEERNSFLNRLSPKSRILCVLSAVFIPVFMGNHIVSTGFILLSTLLPFGSGVIRKAIPILGASGFMVLTVLLIQGLLRAGNETTLSDILGLTFYKEGLMFAPGIVINVLSVILCFCVLVLCTKPSDTIGNFMRRGLSPRFGYAFISLSQLIPQTTEKMVTITDAQKSRGMETEGNLLMRMKALLPLTSSVIMSSFIDTKERAVALEVRGFNAKSRKIFLDEQHATTLDKMIQGFLVLGIVGAIGWRIMTWLG